MAAKSITTTLSADQVSAAIERPADGSPERRPLQNGLRLIYRFGGQPVGLNVFPSKSGGCKVVFDRPETPEADAIAAAIGGAPSALKARTSTVLAPAIDDAPVWLGSDESGKGDYFGPLVVAAVAVTSTNWRVLEELGVRDSKAITDARADAIAGQVREAFPHEVVTITPRRYNELWQSMGSVNRVLAWAHARAIEETLGKAPDAAAAISDQFGDEALIRNALFQRGREVRLLQMPRAEADPAVAAASILARAEFLRRLDAMGGRLRVRLLKGASARVDALARELVGQHGPAILDEVAKKHFKTTERVLGPRS